MKQRLDVALVERALAPSREKAQGYIMAGAVYVNGEKAQKAGHAVVDRDRIEVRGPALQYVSRGGLKLEKALQAFPIRLEGCVCMDIGASTGGFTDCMLQNGAKKVYAVDVGYGQLAWTLRQDGRVVNLERTNIRYIDGGLIAEPLDFASIDVSFISLRLVLPVAARLLKGGAGLAALIKPQFEAGREKVGKKGVVREPETHREVIESVLGYAGEAGLSVRGLTHSPVKGPEGNIEYLLYAQKGGETGTLDPAEAVSAAHRELSV